MRSALRIQVKGIVQGVGFRPFVYRQARRHLVAGWVLNAADGVTIHAEAEDELLDAFVLAVANEAPAAARVDELQLDEVPLEDFEGFEIRFSQGGRVEQTTLVSPDLATCADCERELFDPADRRYRYPFINCTNCGPRFTIINALPYDRPATSMAGFPMCEPCAAEYADPADRRFHAQPDACPDCGPQAHLRLTRAGAKDAECAQLVVAAGSEALQGLPGAVPARAVSECEGAVPGGAALAGAALAEGSDAVFAMAVELLLRGKILAVKGLGGFHLVCDAGNAQSVAKLRERKHRDGKALAVMMPGVEAARAFCLVNDAEAGLLAGSVRPIVLLRRRWDAGAQALTPGLADGLAELGVMLPYTPVQHLLMHDFAAAGGTMLVMTSGNLHDEPIVTGDEEALEKLGDIADAVLGNNRPICARYDDSVVRVIDAAGETAVQMVRRARGYAPVPIAVAAPGVSAASGVPEASVAVAAPEDGRAAGCAPLLAVGPEQKNTFCLLRAASGDGDTGSAEAFVSQHIGDLENAESFDAWLEASARYQGLFDIKPAELVCDMHPEYLSTKWAREQGLPCDEVQHHHAHIAAVLAEAGIQGPVCGIAFDGTGYGMDGAIWGGEVLLANLTDFERFANLAYVPMPGGAAAVKNPLRMAYGVLWAFDLLDHPYAVTALAGLDGQGDFLEQMIEKGINTPYTSSCGRLFDAASALLGGCPHPTYEGEAAIMLEACMAGGQAAAGESAAADGQLAAGDPAADGQATANSGGFDQRYALEITKNVASETSTAHDTSVLLMDAAPTFRALLDDAQAGVPVAQIARNFHDAFVQAVVQMAQVVRAMYDINTVALGGGVFMNRYLMEHVLAALAREGFSVAIGKELPPNDGCISLGQAAVGYNRQMHTV